MKTNQKRTKWVVTVLSLTMAAIFLTGCSQKYQGITVKAKDYVTLGTYTGVEASVANKPITDELIEESILAVLAKNPKLVEVTDRDVAENGDIVNLDFKGTKDGVAFEGGTAAGQYLEIGSGSTIPGFEDGIIGKKVGETFTVPMQFPESYPEPTLAGQDVEFEMTLNGIYCEEVPELNDETIQSLNIGYNTVAELSDYMRTYLQDQYDQNAKAAVWQKVNEDCTFGTLPTELYDANYTMLMDEVKNYAENYYGVDLNTYIENTGFTPEEFAEATKSQAEALTKETLVCYAIAEEQGFTITEEDIQTYANEHAGDFGFQTGADFIKQYGMGGVERYLMAEKVQLYLMETAVIIEAANE